MGLWILWRYWTIYFIRVINQLIVLGTSLLDMVGWTYTGSDQGWNLTLEFCRDIFSEKCEKRDNQFNRMNWSSFGWRLHRARWGILKMLGTLMTKWEGNHLISFAWPQDSLQLFRSWVLVDFWTRSFFWVSDFEIGAEIFEWLPGVWNVQFPCFCPCPCVAYHWLVLMWLASWVTLIWSCLCDGISWAFGHLVSPGVILGWWARLRFISKPPSMAMYTEW